LADSKITNLSSKTPAVGDELVINDVTDNSDGKITVGAALDIINGDVNVDSSGTSTLAANSVDSDQYVDGSIDNAHLADDAVDSDEIASGAIDLDHVSTAAKTETLIIACSDNTTALETGIVFTFYMPYAMTLTDIKASVLTAPTDATLIVDVHEAGTTIMTTDKLDIESGEFHTKDATDQPALTDTALANNAKIEIEIDQVGSTVAGAGLIVYLIGYQT